LYKLEQTPVEISFGTVVAERIVDVICLILLIVISFVVEWEKLSAFMGTLNVASEGFRLPSWVILAMVLLVLAVGSIYFFRKNERLKKILVGFKQGLMSVFSTGRPLLFVMVSVAIWGLYFLMSYFIIMAFPETKMLGFSAVLTLFAIGSIAMAAPLPGGAGSYHTLVPIGLVMLYHLPQQDAIAFVFIFHAWQTALMIVLGIVSLLISYLILKWKRPAIK
jgi:glycosyltransferase 2 family protein